MKRTILALVVVAMLVAVGWLFVLLRPDGEGPAVTAANRTDNTIARVGDRDQSSAAPRSAREAVTTGLGEPPLDAITTKTRTPELQRTGRVRGRLVDLTRVPVAGLTVAAHEHWLSRPATSDDDGRFEIVATIPAAWSSVELNLVARGRGHGATKVPGKVRVGATNDVGDIVVAGAAIGSGRIVDEVGQALGDIEVRCTAATIAPRDQQYRGPYAWTSETRSELSGAFRLADVPSGSVRIWAGADDRFWTASPALELEPGSERTDIELIVQSIPRDDMVVVAVLDPDNAPVAGAHLMCQSSGTTSGSTDERGRFVHFTMNQKRLPVTIVATDPYERWLPVVAENVQPGTLDLVLQLGRPTTMQLHVVDETGEPVEMFGARSLVDSKWLGGKFPPLRQAHHAQGGADFVVPTLSFSIEVDAPTFALAQIGPFEPSSAPASLEIRLHSLPGLRGIVRTPEGPLAGASVSSHLAVAGDEEYLYTGLPARYLRAATARATTNAHGEFVLTAREPGAFWVRATAGDYAPIDRGPLEVDPAAGTSGLVLELSHGGSIEGRIVGYADESTADLFVAASRGDTYAFTTRTDANGSFRMDGLTPGAWWVGKHAVAIDPESMFSAHGKKSLPAVFTPNCEVIDGQTTRIDVALHAAGAARLRGRLALGGTPALGCKARLSLRGVGSSSTQATTLDAEGRFVFNMDGTGAAELSLETTGAGAQMTCTTRLELASGDNAWERDLEIGSVEGQVPARYAQEHVRVRWSCVVDGSVDCSGRTVADNSGGFAFKLVPAGRVRLVADAPDGSAPAREVELAQGATLRVDL